MKQKILSNKKTLLILPIGVLLLAGSIYYFQVDRNNSDTPPPENSVNEDCINYSPPTEAEKRETDQHKQALGESSNSPSSKQAEVTMTYLYFEDGKANAAGIVNNVFEDGGTCTLVLTKGSLRVTASSVGITDVNKTTCPPVFISSDKLEAGSWNAVLEYNSSSSKGASSPRTINVP